MNNVAVLIVCVSLVVIAAIVLTILLIRRRKQSDGAQDGTQTSSSNGKQVVLVYADWCPHCRKMKPMFQKLMKEYPGKYDMKHGPDFGNAWLTQKQIKAYPAIALYNTVSDTFENVQYGSKSYDEILSFGQ